jgi:hypothetical protein
VYGKPIEGDLLTTGSPLSSPPLIDMISTDPILRGVKVITIDSFIICPLQILICFHQGFLSQKSKTSEGHVEMN